MAVHVSLVLLQACVNEAIDAILAQVDDSGSSHNNQQTASIAAAVSAAAGMGWFLLNSELAMDSSFGHEASERFLFCLFFLGRTALGSHELRFALLWLQVHFSSPRCSSSSYVGAENSNDDKGCRTSAGSPRFARILLGIQCICMILPRIEDIVRITQRQMKRRPLLARVPHR